MKNRLFILGILSLLLVSCSKETAEIPGITGEYIGTYKYINESAHSNNEFEANLLAPCSPVEAHSPIA